MREGVLHRIEDAKSFLVEAMFDRTFVIRASDFGGLMPCTRSAVGLRVEAVVHELAWQRSLHGQSGFIVDPADHDP